MPHCLFQVINAHDKKEYFVSVISESRSIHLAMHNSIESQTARLTFEALLLEARSARSFTEPLMGVGCVDVPRQRLDFNGFRTFMRLFVRDMEISSIGDTSFNYNTIRHCVKRGLIPEYTTIPSVFSPRRLPYLLLFDDRGSFALCAPT
jgi:hypothetical protein